MQQAVKTPLGQKESRLHYNAAFAYLSGL